jgi:hypothetical protein
MRIDQSPPLSDPSSLLQEELKAALPCPILSFGCELWGHFCYVDQNLVRLTDNASKRIMPRLLAGLIITVVSFSALAAEVAIDLAPFEPPYARCFDWKDKFAHPKEIIAPKYVYPEEMRRAGIDGEVVALVTLKSDGTPERISILYDTHERSAEYPEIYFSAAVIDGLKKAKWVSTKQGSVWFYTKVKFVLVEKGTVTPHEAGTVVGEL